MTVTPVASSETDTVLRCTERQSTYDVTLTPSRLHWKTKALYRPLLTSGSSGSAPVQSVFVEVVRNRSIALGIPFVLRIIVPGTDTAGIVFFPRDPGRWLTALEQLGAQVEDRFDVRASPLRTWLSNHFEFVPMLAALPVLLAYCLFLAYRLVA